MIYGIGENQEDTMDNKEETCTKVEEEEVSTMANTRGSGGTLVTGVPDAVVFSIQFYGETIGEVGLLDQDLAQLDWQKFKSYLFQNLLTINKQENICVSYSDEEGDKLPIESDEEYREALKVAKRKAEAHDKMVLDITRQGGLPTVLSLVSGIKRVGSPPKDRGLSLFKAASPPKESGGFSPREWKPFSPFFMHDKGPIPGHVQGNWGYDCDEALESDKARHTTTATTTTTTTTTTAMSPLTDRRKGPPIVSLRDSSPNLLFKFSPGVSPPSTRELSCPTPPEGVFGAGSGGEGARSRRDPGQDLPPPWFTAYMDKFKEEVCEQVSERVMGRVEKLILGVMDEVDPATAHDTKDAKHKVQKEQERTQQKSQRNEDGEGDTRDAALHDLKGKKKLVKMARNDSGAKRKKLIKEEEKQVKKQEKYEKKKLLCKYVDELDKASRAQEKVLAKMEGLRKKQSCSPEELNKLRKMVDKQHRVITAEQRQQRRIERKAGHQRSGKSRKFNIDNKGFPVDASLLHAALQELEALAEDSPSEGAVGGTTRGYDAQYLHDVTFPDGSEVAPGTDFVKTWRVVNSGVLPWNEKTQLCKWSQVHFRGSPAGWKLKPSSKKVMCPALEPGQEGDISITFTAPSEPGWYATHWRFCQRGRVFGNQMWCAIHVVDRSHRETLPHLPIESIKPTISLVTKVRSDVNTGKSSSQASSPHPPSTGAARVTRVGEDDSEGEGGVKGDAAEGDLQCGMLENYYDAEDPFESQLLRNLRSLNLRTTLEPEVTVEKVSEKDLIMFEEEAEMVKSGSTTPELVQDIPQTHSVVPLKEMARESVESLWDSKRGNDKDDMKESSGRRKSVQADVISISSGSISELDSEDQAILNESDTEYSEDDYLFMNIPDCFDVPTSHKADEDDRTTAVVSDLQDDQSESMSGSDNASCNSTSTMASHQTTLVKVPLKQVVITSYVATPNDSQASEDVGLVCIKPLDQQPPAEDAENSQESNEHSKKEKKSSLPAPPPDTKPFMNVPAELLNVNYKVQAPVEDKKHAESKGEATWTSGEQSVVCEQPSSSQHKEPKALPRAAEGSDVDPTADLPADLVSALPDELVSIIPEDLVRGAWNTARSFITRINQEMIAASDFPGHVYQGDSSGAHATGPRTPPGAGEVRDTHHAQQPSQGADSPASAAPLPPLLQQLADMGFGNHEVNQRLLTKYNNDISCAVAELVVLNCQ